MALIAIEGFDHEATHDYTQGGSGNKMFQKSWSEATENPIDFATGRLPYSANSHSLTVIQNNPLIKVFPAVYDELILGFGMRFFSDVFHNGYTFFQIGQGGPSHPFFSLKWDYAWRLVASDKGGVIGTGSTQSPPNVWVYIEIKIVQSTGTFELRLNGLTGEIPSSSGHDFGTGQFDTLVWEPGGLGSDLHIDDFYCLDPSTGVNTDFLGDVVVETLYPINDGTYTDWTPDTGSTHYTRVDESHLDGDNSYVHTTTAGAKDSYGMGNPTLTNTPVYGVQLNLGAKKNDAGGRTIAPFIRQSSTNYFGPTTALTADWFFHSWLLDQDPTGSNWLYTTVNNDEFGAELVS